MMSLDLLEAIFSSWQRKQRQHRGQDMADREAKRAECWREKRQGLENSPSGQQEQRPANAEKALEALNP